MVFQLLVFSYPLGRMMMMIPSFVDDMRGTCRDHIKCKTSENGNDDLHDARLAQRSNKGRSFRGIGNAGTAVKDPE